MKQETKEDNRTKLLTDCEQTSFHFQDLGSREVVADFSGGRLSSDGGVLFLRELDRSLRLIQGLAGCFVDRRDPRFVEHEVEQLLRQRIAAIALGYEDLNDHATLRRDPLLAATAGKSEVLGESREGAALAAAATLNRMETTVDHRDSRYHKIVPVSRRIEDYLLKRAVQTLRRRSREVIIDLDATDDPLHGQQEGRFFHGYYDEYCYLPLYGFIGDALCWAQLRTADRDASDGAVAALVRIVSTLRRRCPKARIILRADSGFCREEILAWCEQHRVDYVLGIARNARLRAELAPALARAREQAGAGGTARVYHEFNYKTLDSWSRARRVVGKAERLGDKDNPRFVVTSLDRPPGLLYEQLYCARGEMENRIKEQQTDLFADRLSCHGFASNQLRLWLAAFAYVWMERLRAVGLRGTELSQATAGTIRLRLLKIAARVEVSVRRLRVRFAAVFPLQALFATVWRRLQALTG